MTHFRFPSCHHNNKASEPSRTEEETTPWQQPTGAEPSRLPGSRHFQADAGVVTTVNLPWRGHLYCRKLAALALATELMARLAGPRGQQQQHTLKRRVFAVTLEPKWPGQTGLKLVWSWPSPWIWRKKAAGGASKRRWCRNVKRQHEAVRSYCRVRYNKRHTWTGTSWFSLRCCKSRRAVLKHCTLVRVQVNNLVSKLYLLTSD